MSIVRPILILAIRAYQAVISPLLHAVLGPLGGCRFHPTCSVYAAEAIRRHGVIRGSWLAITRLCRCHPWGPSGADPVPEAPPSRASEPRSVVGATDAVITLTR